MAQTDPALNAYILAVQALWSPEYRTDPTPAATIQSLMQTWLRDTEPTAEWATRLKEEKLSKLPLHTEPDNGFVQLAHYHASGRDNSPHDHGPHWVVYGVLSGEVDIPVYEPNSDDTEVQVARVDHLKAGDAVAYYPGEIHSTKVVSDGPAVVLRFLSQDLSDVPRRRYGRDQIS